VAAPDNGVVRLGITPGPAQAASAFDRELWTHLRAAGAGWSPGQA
jgi:hypothetical protein